MAPAYSEVTLQVYFFTKPIPAHLASPQCPDSAHIPVHTPSFPLPAFFTGLKWHYPDFVFQSYNLITTASVCCREQQAL